MNQLMSGLIQVKGEGWTGFSKGWQGCTEGFPRAKPEANPEEQPCHPRNTPFIPTLILGFTVYLKYDIFVTFVIFQILTFEEA